MSSNKFIILLADIKINMSEINLSGKQILSLKWGTLVKIKDRLTIGNKAFSKKTGWLVFQSKRRAMQDNENQFGIYLPGSVSFDFPANAFEVVGEPLDPNLLNPNDLRAKLFFGGGCRFCHRVFIDHNSKPFFHMQFTICKVCITFPLADKLDYHVAVVQAIEDPNFPVVKKSVILNQMADESSKDVYYHMLMELSEKEAENESAIKK